MQQKLHCVNFFLTLFNGELMEISKTNEINARLRQEGKIIILDELEHLKAIQNLNEQM